MGVAQDHCPWINKATAEGVLGTDATESVKVGKGPPETTVCKFLAKGPNPISDLQVDVIQMKDVAKEFPLDKAQCGPDATPLRGIGNEAELCSVKTPGTMYMEKVIGRVRDRAFIVTLTLGVDPAQSVPEDVVREKADSAAEEVAGNLF